MKLELAVRLTDDNYEDQKGFSFEIPYGAHEEGVDDKLVDLLNTAVNWTDVVPAMCDHIRRVKPNPIQKEELRGDDGAMASQMELVKAQMEAQQQQQEQKEQETKE